MLGTLECPVCQSQSNSSELIARTQNILKAPFSGKDYTRRKVQIVVVLKVHLRKSRMAEGNDNAYVRETIECLLCSSQTEAPS